MLLHLYALNLLCRWDYMLFSADSNCAEVRHNKLKFLLCAALMLGCLSQSHLISASVSVARMGTWHVFFSPLWTLWTVSAVNQDVVHSPEKYSIITTAFDVQRCNEISEIKYLICSKCNEIVPFYPREERVSDVVSLWALAKRKPGSCCWENKGAVLNGKSLSNFLTRHLEASCLRHGTWIYLKVLQPVRVHL